MEKDKLSRQELEERFLIDMDCVIKKYMPVLSIMYIVFNLAEMITRCIFISIVRQTNLEVKESGGTADQASMAIMEKLPIGVQIPNLEDKLKNIHEKI